MIVKFSQLRRISEYLAFPLGLLALCIAVFPVHTLGFELPKFAVLTILALGCSVTFLLKRTRWIELLLRSVPGIVYLCFGLVIACSLLWSVAPVSAFLGSPPRFQGVLAHVCFLILGIYGVQSMQSKRGRNRISRAIILSNTVVVFYGIAQMLHLDPFADIWQLDAFLGRIFSTIGHPNALGQFVLLTIPFVVLRWLQPAERVVRMGWGSLLILNGAVLMGTVSRSALLGAALLALLCIPSFKLWIAKRIHLVKPEQAFALSMITVLCVSIGLLFFSQRFSLTIEGSRSVASREVIWDGTIKMIAARPYGYGLESMAFISPQFIGKDLYRYESLTTTVDRAHNEFLQMLFTLGPAGLVTYSVLIALLLLAAWRFGKARDHDGILRASVAGILGFQVALFFGFASMATAALFWLLVGCAIGVLPQKKRTVPLRISDVGNFLLVCISTIAVVVSLQWMQSRFIHAYAGMSDGAVRMFPYDRESLIETAEVSLRALESNQSENTEALLKGTRDLIAILRQTTGGRDGMAWLLEGWMYATQGDVQRTKMALAQAKVFLPTSMTYHRTEEHIFHLLHDEEGQVRARQSMRELLPEEFFIEGSELKRILVKQHAWLKELE